MIGWVPDCTMKLHCYVILNAVYITNAVVVKCHGDDFNCGWKVKLLESMKTMNEESFKAYFGDELMWTATLSNGSVVHLKPGHDDDGASSHVHFADRLKYIDLVKQARMNESRQQVFCLHLMFCGIYAEFSSISA